MKMQEEEWNGMKATTASCRTLSQSATAGETEDYKSIRIKFEVTEKGLDFLITSRSRTCSAASANRRLVAVVRAFSVDALIRQT
ncbi:MAG: hypothetical protein U0Y68_14375 [Blastocatellia bacterium]